ISFPGGMMGTLLGKPLVLHEQNSVAGMANKVLAGVADRVFTAFPDVMRKGEWVGNPLRAPFLHQPPPAERFAGRSGPLRLLVVSWRAGGGGVGWGPARRPEGRAAGAGAGLAAAGGGRRWQGHEEGATRGARAGRAPGGRGERLAHPPGHLAGVLIVYTDRLL